jgi:hypothetical protein
MRELNAGDVVAKERHVKHHGDGELPSGQNEQAKGFLL